MEHEDTIVGCGGYSLSADRSAAELQWGMVHAAFQRNGFGRFLLMYRIREIGRAGSVSMVAVRPPQHAIGFFEKQGFRANGPELIRKLTVCS
jgi:GNAT superfamily N-acetyltransferase